MESQPPLGTEAMSERRWTETFDEVDRWTFEVESPFRPAHEIQALVGETAPGEAGGPLLETEVWSDSADQVAFREAVLRAHLERARRRRGPPQSDLSPQQLAPVAGTTISMRADAAAAAGRMLAAANSALSAGKVGQDADALRTVSLTASSGYRGRAHQEGLWRGVFRRYYNETQSARAGMQGGPQGAAAITYMLETYRVPSRIAAPGYSNHQNGIAIDLRQRRTRGNRIRNSTAAKPVTAWRSTWFFTWIQSNAATFGFQPYTREPWHWEFRPGGAARETEATYEQLLGAEQGYEHEESEDLEEDLFGPEEAEEPIGQAAAASPTAITWAGEAGEASPTDDFEEDFEEELASAEPAGEEKDFETGEDEGEEDEEEDEEEFESAEESSEDEGEEQLEARVYQGDAEGLGSGLFETLVSSVVTTCRPGEGPPAALPDPEGKGLHPLVYRGVTARRSRNPTVGDAQIQLNRFLDATRTGSHACDDGSAATMQFMARLRARLRANGQDPLKVDCRFGVSTELATKIFQACHGLKRDGKIGPLTWARLAAFAPSAPPAPPAPPSPPLSGPVMGPRPCCLLRSGSLKDAASMGVHTDWGGIVYTGRAGFVDIGHVRDVADLTAFAYQQIHAASGASGTRVTTAEGHATLTSAVPAAQWLETARSIAFDDALGHEIKTYHDTLIPGGHNSAFSPEDLCSNFLGTLVAARALIAGGNFSTEVESQTQSLLTSLNAQSLAETQAAFGLIDGRWVVSGLLGPGDPRYLRRRNFTRIPFKAGHPSDASTPSFVTAAFALATLPYDYRHTAGMTFARADFPTEISTIKTDARTQYGPDFDKP